MAFRYVLAGRLENLRMDFASSKIRTFSFSCIEFWDCCAILSHYSHSNRDLGPGDGPSRLLWAEAVCLTDARWMQGKRRGIGDPETPLPMSNAPRDRFESPAVTMLCRIGVWSALKAMKFGAHAACGMLCVVKTTFHSPKAIHDLFFQWCLNVVSFGQESNQPGSEPS